MACPASGRGGSTARFALAVPRRQKCSRKSTLGSGASDSGITRGHLSPLEVGVRGGMCAWMALPRVRIGLVRPRLRLVTRQDLGDDRRLGELLRQAVLMKRATWCRRDAVAWWAIACERLARAGDGRCSNPGAEFVAVWRAFKQEGRYLVTQAAEDEGMRRLVAIGTRPRQEQRSWPSGRGHELRQAVARVRVLRSQLRRRRASSPVLHAELLVALRTVADVMSEPEPARIGPLLDQLGYRMRAQIRSSQAGEAQIA